METFDKQLAAKLLEIKAVKLRPQEPFTWASGWKSPIYCDNRKPISYPALRSAIKVEEARLVCEMYPQATCIAGVATGAITQGALVADALGLPYVYIRPKPKDHGLGNLIEGDLMPGARVVVIEDLVSTGKSSLAAVEALRAAGAEVLGMIAGFTYQFPVAEAHFREAGVELTTLSHYTAVLEAALASGYISESDLSTLHEWRANPSQWRQEP